MPVRVTVNAQGPLEGRPAKVMDLVVLQLLCSSLQKLPKEKDDAISPGEVCGTSLLREVSD